MCKIEEGDRLSLNKLLENPSHDPKSLIINSQRETLLHLACRKGHLDLVRALIEIYSCNLMPVDKDGNSPFHVGVTLPPVDQLMALNYPDLRRRC